MNSPLSELCSAQWVSHQQMLSVICTAQDDIVHFAYIHQLGAARVRNGALQILLHLNQGVGQAAFDRLQNTFAFHVLVFALVEVRGLAVIFLEQADIDFHRLSG